MSNHLLRYRAGDDMKHATLPCASLAPAVREHSDSNSPKRVCQLLCFTSVVALQAAGYDGSSVLS